MIANRKCHASHSGDVSYPAIGARKINAACPNRQRRRNRRNRKAPSGCGIAGAPRTFATTIGKSA